MKVTVREGASLIPCASYQTLSRLQQLLSAQNTQALPFQLKGSLTKRGGKKRERKKKYPASKELVSLQGEGLSQSPSTSPIPAGKYQHNLPCGVGKKNTQESLNAKESAA